MKSTLIFVLRMLSNFLNLMFNLNIFPSLDTVLTKTMGDFFQYGTDYSALSRKNERCVYIFIFLF
jgi:hypothetical protein